MVTVKVARVVDISVELGDALTRETDVLVLKYAQRLHGVDRAAIRRMGGLDPSTLPAPGASLAVRNPRGLGARNLLILGTAELVEFGYDDIRAFGATALSTAAKSFPAAREISLTLHGVGLGLDEAEAFQAEVAGVLDAYGLGRAGPRLRRVAVVEVDQERVRRLEGLLPRPARDRVDGASEQRFTTAGVESARKQHAFVAMPFAAEWEDHFYFGIQPPLKEAGMVCERMDQLSFTGDVIEMMKSRIDRSDVVVADISTANPNVYLEIGYAWARQKSTILLCSENGEPHFDLQSQRHIRYGSIRDLARRLTGELEGLGFA